MNQDWKDKLNELRNVVKSAGQESDMDNTNKAVEQVKENVNTIVNAGKEAVSNPRVIGEKLAKAFNKITDKKGSVRDAFKMGFEMFKEGVKEVKAGYQETRYKEPTKPVDKSNI